MPEPCAAPPSEPRSKDRKGVIAGTAVAASFAMLLLAFASAPLYRMFCAATGYGGTPQVAETAPGRVGARRIMVRFDANVGPGLSWRFEPETPQIRLRAGETATVFFKVVNLTDRPLSARAAYNVGPDAAGVYFNKLNCFCFSEQKLDAHESAELPVVFFLDPALETDETMRGVETVTLSYTFFASQRPASLSIGAQGGGKPL